MPAQEILILAVTRMLGGVCIAGMTQEPEPVTGLRWVRPVPEHSHVLLGDITTPEGVVLSPFDVVEFSLIRPHPDLPHTEDWVTDFRQRPRIVRRLEGERRTRFLHKHLDRAPGEVLHRQERSLCLLKPDWVKGAFRLDDYTNEFDARLSFGLGSQKYRGSIPKGGLAVTDLKWRALGRSWLPAEGGWVDFDQGDLEARFGIQEIYLAVGLTRSHEGSYWPIVIGVHTLPDHQAIVDYCNL
jgi:hypothetical protein